MDSVFGLHEATTCNYAVQKTLTNKSLNNIPVVITANSSPICNKMPIKQTTFMDHNSYKLVEMSESVKGK
jgi:hypothetical protein